MWSATKMNQYFFFLDKNRPVRSKTRDHVSIQPQPISRKIDIHLNDRQKFTNEEVVIGHGNLQAISKLHLFYFIVACHKYIECTVKAMYFVTHLIRVTKQGELQFQLGSRRIKTTSGFIVNALTLAKNDFEVKKKLKEIDS